MAASVHPTAIVGPSARLADDVRIGPACVVSGAAEIGHGTTLANNVTIVGRVVMGADNTVHPYAVIGGEPQDVSYRGSPTRVVNRCCSHC